MQYNLLALPVAYNTLVAKMPRLTIMQVITYCVLCNYNMCQNVRSGAKAT